MRYDAPELDRFADMFCLDMISKAVSRFIEDNFHRLENRSRIVREPQSASLYDCRIEFTTEAKTYDKAIGFDAVVSAEIEICETRRGEDFSDTISEWFRVPCQVLFEEVVERQRINGSVERYTRAGFKYGQALAATTRLVPVIFGENYDDEATRFLKKYCPEALDEPMPVPLDKIAEAMGLPPINYDKHLSPDFSVFGKICFHDEEMDVYDSNGVPEKIFAKRSQIFIDSDTYALCNVGCLRNTIAHELFHWARHRLYATIKRIVDEPDFKSTRCRCRPLGIAKSKDEELTDEEWMELHANAISPRIIMPIETAKPKAESLLEKHEYESWKTHAEKEEILRAVIADLSDFFQVSKQLATIRLAQFGIKQAQEILDKDYKQDVVEESQVSHTDILREYAENEGFRLAVDSGYFRYAEGRFIINDQKYIRKEQGGIYLLTDYAREHLDECALQFNTVTPHRYQYLYYSGRGFDRKNRQSYATVKKYVEDAIKFETAEAWAKASAAFKSEAVYHKKLIAAVGSGTCFAESFNALMKAVFSNIGVPEHKQGAKFFEATGIADNTYRAMRNAKPDYCPKDRTLVAICAGFDLDISVAERLFASGGKVLRHTDEHLAFRIILTACRGWGITERNDYLEILGFGRLTDDI